MTIKAVMKAAFFNCGIPLWCRLRASAVFAPTSGSFATLAAMRRAIQVEIRKGLVASVAALLYAADRPSLFGKPIHLRLHELSMNLKNIWENLGLSQLVHVFCGGVD